MGVNTLLLDVLGPLRLVTNDHDITPSAPKIRQVLAALAVYANTVVRNEQIIEELWGEQPPVSVTTTLQTYVYQLRRLLRTRGEPDQASTLHTSNGGYLLSLPAEAVDSFRFAEAAKRGRTELQAGQVAEASRMLGEALNLWRGAALVDVQAGAILRAETLRLEELRRNTLEQRIDADLRLGRHQELLGELTALAAQQPTHEGFQRSLMLALHRAGRRSEALRVYQRARAVLAEELGLDPSAELQRVHAALLDSDRSLDLPAPESVTIWHGTRPPCYLPPRGPELVGRQRELTQVIAALTSAERTAPPVVVVTGAPGAGKSAFGVHAAYRVRADYPDGQLYHRMPAGGQTDPGHVLGVFLRGLGVPEDRIPQHAQDRCLLFRTHTVDRKVLVVLDDITTMEQLEALLPAGDGCGVLAISRCRLSGTGITASVELAPLDTDSGLAVLTGVLGSERVRRDLASAQALVRLCDGLPTALRKMITMLQLRPHWRIERLITWVRQNAGDSSDPGDVLGLRSAVEQTYWGLRADVREMFTTLVELDDATLTAPMVAMALGIDEPSAEGLLEELVEAHLVSATTDDSSDAGYRYRCLPAVRQAGAGLSKVRMSTAEAFSQRRRDAVSTGALALVPSS